MSKKININWNELKKLGERTSENVLQFENSRKKLQDVTMSLNECWTGQDADNFRLTMCSYLNSLQEDTVYMADLIRFFDKSSRKYNGGVNDGVSRVRSFNNEIFSNKLNGVNNNV